MKKRAKVSVAPVIPEVLREGSVSPVTSPKTSPPPTRPNSPTSDQRPSSLTITPIRIMASSEEPSSGRRQLSLSPARRRPRGRGQASMSLPPVSAESAPTICEEGPPFHCSRNCSISAQFSTRRARDNHDQFRCPDRQQVNSRLIVLGFQWIRYLVPEHFRQSKASMSFHPIQISAFPRISAEFVQSLWQILQQG